MRKGENPSRPKSLSERVEQYRREVQRLVQQGLEHPRYEFKRECSIAKENLATRDKDYLKARLDFIKLVQGLANTHLHEERFIVIGADQKARQFFPVSNLAEFDPAKVSEVLEKYLHPVPSLEVFNRLQTDDGCPFVLVVLAATQPRPISAKADVSDSGGSLLIREGDIWIKSGTKLRRARPEDWHEVIEEWAAKAKRKQRLTFTGLTIGVLMFLGLGYYLRGLWGHKTVPAPAATAPLAKETSTGRFVLAVLPFHVLNASEQIAYLSIGIPDSIITRLANIKEMRLRPTSSILHYENQTVDPQEAGRALRSDYVLTGTVQKVGERFRTSVQLVAVRDGAPLWGRHYDMAHQDMLGLQDDIAKQLASALKIQMTAAEQERVYRRYTENVVAYELYLKGRKHLLRHTEESIRAAAEAFENALQIDANYALAHAGLAMASAEMPSRFAHGAEVESWRTRAKKEAYRALELDQSLAEAHLALATVYRRTEYDWGRTIEESRRVLELNPSLDLPHYYLGAAFYHLGLLELVDREVRAGLEINPEDRVEALRTQGVATFLSVRFAEAVPLLEEVQRLSAKAQSDLWLARAYYYQGQWARAEAMLNELSRSSSASAGTRAKAELASFLAARGERARAETLIRAVTGGTYLDHHVAYSLGVAYVGLGRADEALRWLRQAVDTGFPCYPWYARDPLLQPLRDQPEFKSFLEELRQLWESANARYGPK